MKTTIENSIIRCYNMFPTMFRSIKEMTKYLSHLKTMGFNVVWVNPIQHSENVAQVKADILSGVSMTRLSYSLYAMNDHRFIDQRTSMVKPGPSGIALDKTMASSLNSDQLHQMLELHRNFDELGLKIQSKGTQKERLKEEVVHLKDQRKSLIAKDKKLIELREMANTIDKKLPKAQISKLKTDFAEQTQKRVVEITAEFDQIIADAEKQIQVVTDAMSDLENQISRNFEQQKIIAATVDKNAIRAFTDKAKELGITPIFDLVMNHVQQNAFIIKAHPAWFDDDQTYIDAVGFCYGQLVECGDAKKLKMEMHRVLEANDPVKHEQIKKEYEARITQAQQIFNESPKGLRIKKITEEIIEQYWKPYIKKYINDFGFSGVRVDCIRKIPQEVRAPLYAYIKELTNGTAVILEEALFSDKTPQEFLQTVKPAGGTHITGSVFYRKREWHGGLQRQSPYGAPFDPNNEEYYKRKMVTGGVINFTGNHDHHSCAMEVALNLARERLDENVAMKKIYEKTSQVHTSRMQEIRESQFLYSYVKDIQKELEHPEEFPETVKRFKNLLMDKIAINAFAGSGGYYMLSGDEFGSLYTPSVFLRENRYEVYPQFKLNGFKSIEDKKERKETLNNIEVAIDQVLREIATAKFKRELDGLHKGCEADYKTLNAVDQERVLLPYIDQVKLEITSEDNFYTEEFKKKLREKLKTNRGVDFDTLFREIFTQIPIPRTVENAWGAPVVLREFMHEHIMQQMNKILVNLPKPVEGFWSEVFKLDENFFVAVRKNGPGYTSPTDIVLINLDPSTSKYIDTKGMMKIANWMQQRGFPPKSEHFIKDDIYVETLNGLYSGYYKHIPEFFESYNCIMGLQGLAFPRLHLGEGVIAANDLKEDFVIATKPTPRGITATIDPEDFAFTGTNLEAKLAKWSRFTDFLQSSGESEPEVVEPAIEIESGPKIQSQ